MKSADVKFTDNSAEVLKALPEQIERALLAIGLTAESYAKENCPVDTGRLRNSITFALAGQSANTPTYTDNDKNEYSYKGKAPKDKKNEYSVYIGSNVEYAAFVELGTSKMRARPYLTPAATQHSDEYKSILKDSLENG